MGQGMNNAASLPSLRSCNAVTVCLSRTMFMTIQAIQTHNLLLFLYSVMKSSK